jgi:hypothetical protein
MKTKSFLITVLIILSGILNVNSVFAKDTNNTDDNVTLNIILNPIQTIQVNSDQKTVDIAYSEINDYRNGLSVNKLDHLQIFSTGGFVVKVNSAEKLTNNKGKEISASDITVLATPGTDNGLVMEESEAVALGSEQKTLITSKTGGRDLKYNVTYNNELGGNDNYLNLYDKDANNIFTTEVTYTIIAN